MSKLIKTNSNDIVNIFESFAEKFFECGLSVIPVGGKKNPLIKSWSEYSKRLPNSVEVESWVKQYPKANIAVVTGKASGIVALDYDAWPEEVNHKLLNHIPKSSVERVGEKGFARFFKYNGEKNKKYNYLKLELFSNGGCIILPPSIHPNTREPYRWTALTDLCNPDFMSELTYLNLDTLKEFEAMNASIGKGFKSIKKTSLGHSKLNSSGGRNNKLFEICSAMVGEKKPFKEIKQKLLAYDINHHNIPWFSDPTESHSHGNDAEKNVTKMIERVVEMDSLNKIQTQTEEVPKPIKKEYQLPFVDFPKPDYFLKKLTDFCLGLSHVKRKNFSLASVCSLIGTLLSNKTTLEGTAPCLYQLFVANSGEGKDIPLKFPENILAQTMNIGLIGMGNYRSDKAIVAGFDRQLSRIDIIDEISKVFKQMNSKNSSPYSMNISELLTELWSSSNNLFKGFTTAQGTVGFCFSPCLSILGATTPKSFSGSFSEENVMQGFGGRFIYLYESEQKPSIRKKPFNINNLPEDLVCFVNYFARSLHVVFDEIDVESLGMTTEDIAFIGGEKKTESIYIIKKPIPYDLLLTKEADSFLETIHTEYFNKISKSVKYTIQPVVLRAYENLLKISQIHWASRVYYQFLDGTIDFIAKPWFEERITKEDLVWAKQYIDASLCNSERLFDKTLMESRFHRQSVVIEDVIKDNGGEISKRNLTQALRRKFKSKELYDENNGLIPELIRNGIIKEHLIQKDNQTGFKTYYILI